ncbi:MAG: capsule assembly Wzi family protein [Gemmatimonadota bacterium]
MTGRFRFAITVAGLMAAATPVAGQATAYVQQQDAAYTDLDVLIAAGLVRNVIAGERPYSRAAFRRFVDEARSRAGAAAVSSRIVEAIERLGARFAGAEPATRRLSLTSAEARLALAASPYRPHRMGDTTDAGSPLDADLNPLLLGTEARRFADGGTASVEAGLELGSRFFAAQVVPRVSLFVPHSGFSGYATLVNAYGRFQVGPAALDIGRNSRSVGHGLAGGAMLSRNSPGLDMVRVAFDRPVRLPLFLDALGLWQASIGVADLGDGQDQPGSVLTHMRLSGRPSAFGEFGITYFNIQGGHGSPPSDWAGRIHDLFFFWSDGGFLTISDKVAGVDMRLFLPSRRASVNVNFLTTDDRGRFTQPARGYWEDAVWQAGADIAGLGPEGRTDLAIEWAHAGPRAHTHGQFTSGVTLRRRVLGNALGPNASGVTVLVTENKPTSRLRVTGAWERYSGDDWFWALIPGGAPWDYDWFRAADNPDEIRVRILSEYVRERGWRGMETSIRLGYEHVTRFNYGTTGRHNLVADVALRYAR